MRSFSFMLALLTACAAATGEVKRAPLSRPPIIEKIQALARIISGLRGLKARELKVELAPEAELGRVIREETLALVALPQERAGLTAMLGSLEGFEDTRLAESPVEVVYDSTQDRLLVKLGTSETEPRLLFAREIARALLPAPKTSSGFDAALTARALLRGDAALVMLADAQLKRSEGSLPIAAERTRVFMAAQPDEALLDAAALSRALMDAPRWLRDRALLGASDGFSLAVALHRTGGFALLDAAHASPPTSTEQVLHPDAYVADDRPVRISDPRTPSATKLLSAANTLGELAYRGLFEQCMPRPRAKVAAEGWGGDIFVVAERADKARVIAASTAWDTEADAKEAEVALRDLGTCWVKRESARTFHVARRGSDVAYVSGLTEEAAHTELVALLSLERMRETPTPPFGQRPLARETPLPELAAERRGVAKDGLYTSERFGLRMVLPPSFSANTALASAELLLRGGRQSASSGVFTASKIAWSTQHQEDLFASVAAMFVQQMGPRAHLTQQKDAPITLLGTAGRERIYTIDSTEVSIRVVLVPMCEKRWMLAFFSSSVSENDRMGLENWIASAHFIAERPPVCDE